MRVGIVGGGFMARTHTLAYDAARLLHGEELPTLERVRLAEASEELAACAATRLGWREATTDWRDITRASDIDLVDIVTPNHLHAEIAIDAARHGKAVLCEKPLAHTLDAAWEMHAAVRAAGVANQIGFVFRTWPAIALARRLVSEGSIGRIRHFRAHYFHDYALDPEFPLGWRFQRASAGGGSVCDLGSHLFDLASCLVGEVDRVCARVRTVVPARPRVASGELVRVDVDDAADVLLEFATGATGVVETNWAAAGYKTDLAFELLGEQGTIGFTWRRNNELRLYEHGEPPDVRGFRTIVVGPMHEGADGFWPVAGQGLGYGDAFVIAARQLLSGLGSGRALEPDFGDGLRAAVLTSAALRSAQRQAWLEVNEVGRDD